MSGYNFARKSDIEKAIKLVRKSSETSLQPLAGTHPVERITHGFLFETPQGGILGLDTNASPNVARSADCTPYFINENGELIEMFADDGSPQTYPVFNVSSSKVQGYAIIQAKLVYGKLVVDMEDCG